MIKITIEAEGKDPVVFENVTQYSLVGCRLAVGKVPDTILDAAIGPRGHNQLIGLMAQMTEELRDVKAKPDGGS